MVVWVVASSGVQLLGGTGGGRWCGSERCPAVGGTGGGVGRSGDQLPGVSLVVGEWWCPASWYKTGWVIVPKRGH